MKNRGILIVLSGPSGTGKDSILRELKNLRSDFEISVSCTTRKPRVGEIDGKDYYFLTKDEFKQKVDAGDMLEWATFCGNYYGTPKHELEDRLDAGLNIILEIEVNGAEQVIRNSSEAVSIFVLPPSVRVLKERLKNRGLDSEEAIEMRTKEAEREIALAENYDYVVVNDDLKECASDISKIIDSEKLRIIHRKNIIKEVLKNERVVSR
ncbi:MAG: guanylate kinase [Clostridia bacterium]|nr:guanylate kinase [Clostridia bacterium]